MLPGRLAFMQRFERTLKCPIRVNGVNSHTDCQGSLLAMPSRSSDDFVSRRCSV